MEKLNTPYLGITIAALFMWLGIYSLHSEPNYTIRQTLELNRLQTSMLHFKHRTMTESEKRDALKHLFGE